MKKPVSKKQHTPTIAAKLDKLKKHGIPQKSKAHDEVMKNKHRKVPAAKTTLKPGDDVIPFDIGAASETEANAAVPPDKLERAIKLGEKMRAAGDEVDRIGVLLKDATTAYNKIAMDELPTLLRELKLKEITLADGSKIAVKKEYNAAITDERRDEALKWLTDNKFGGMIKSAVTIEFPSGKEKAAGVFARKMQKEFDEVTLKAGVHAATLKAFVKEQLEAGAKKFPLKLFGVHEYFVAKLTQPKGK